MRSNALETLMAPVVLALAAFFLGFAVANGRFRTPENAYRVTAEFSNAGGVAADDEVRINGIPVGRVTAVSIDPKTLSAVVSMLIRPTIRLPVDTVVSVGSKNVLGGKVVTLRPGTARRFVRPGGRLARARSFQPLEAVVGREIYGSGPGP